MALSTEHSPKFKQIKTWYDMGIWSKEKVRQAVDKKWITEAECNEIVGA